MILNLEITTTAEESNALGACSVTYVLTALFRNSIFVRLK